jgi:hypothetical protein
VFASGSEGSAPAPWLTVGHVYVFRLYSTVSGRRLLARLKIGQPAALEVVALPANPQITSGVVNRLLQVLAFCLIPLLALLAAMHVRDVTRND